MAENKMNNGVAVTGAVGTVATVATAVIGTTLAAPLAISAGVGLAIWGAVELFKSSKE
ncbi:hypothetical protein G1K75_01380 [Tenacibaculum finnmarkense]|uniref:Uncharacterized protein n=1 Tax=Tenacibaculum piscium TaxID=1458515 RepID=A0A2H1YIP6_9FLAO|nr:MULTISPECIES: hypothetical protein [Tenacibaculum]MBE7628502.1 hypothetical protein [Tenacibaculum piscium]MBE7669642.1 hypothetical protein [Tenacibaculum piscium]MBE7684769.1 hypothetical protein [Tenacibaculum piscium]MBE7689389.1 hypothetical protein [Tenacibaculum piscium]MBE7691596.1 hypothetical protein [Tenacibaculum finnmarkense genomovar finnmarkense]